MPVVPAVSEIERAVLAFRREHGSAYLKQLSGVPSDPRIAHRARAFLCSERGRELLSNSRDSGELDEAGYAAVCAHVVRALVEQHFEKARSETSALETHEVSVEGDTRALGTLLGEWTGQRNAAQRDRLLRSMAPALASFATELVGWRARVDSLAGALLADLSPPRHPDAGPEGGSSALARDWLERTEDVAQEALMVARRTLRLEAQTGFDALWLSLGQDFAGLFSRDGRMRRLASDWEPLGLRRLLSARARAAPAHPGPFAAAHLVVLAAPLDVRVSPSAREYGLASELASAEAIGRAVGHVHASEALSPGLRHASVATVSRALGSLAVQRFLEPRFLRKVRGLSERESAGVARVAAAYYLLDSRLAAASVLTRGLHGASVLDEIAVVVERALLGTVQPGPAAALALRLSPGGPLRAKVHGPALSWALRERFDDDWYLNPRSAEPLRGALARAGELSIESFAEELGTSPQRAVEKVSELF
jgi:hypothetical protein